MALTADHKGRWAEDQAKGFLQKKGYEMIVSRYKCPYGEIDLVMAEGKTLVAVEVKYRRYFQDAAQAIHSPQKQRIQNAVCYYLSQDATRNLKYPFIRFDVVLLCQSQQPFHIINAWQTQDSFYGL